MNGAVVQALYAQRVSSAASAGAFFVQVPEFEIQISLMGLEVK